MEINDMLDIPVVEKTSLFDAKAYEGKKVLIQNVEVKEEINFYPDGINYDPKSTDIVKRVYFISEPLKELDKNGNFTDKPLMKTLDDGTQGPITIHSRFNLQKDKDGQWVISKSPKAKLWQGMRKLGVSTLREVKGKFVMLDTQTSKDPTDTRVFLRLNL